MKELSSSVVLECQPVSASSFSLRLVRRHSYPRLCACVCVCVCVSMIVCMYVCVCVCVLVAFVAVFVCSFPLVCYCVCVWVCLCESIIMCLYECFMCTYVLGLHIMYEFCVSSYVCLR